MTGRTLSFITMLNQPLRKKSNLLLILNTAIIADFKRFFKSLKHINSHIIALFPPSSAHSFVDKIA